MDVAPRQVVVILIIIGTTPAFRRAIIGTILALPHIYSKQNIVCMHEIVLEGSCRTVALAS